MLNAASRPVVVTSIASTCTGPTTAGPDGSTASPPPRPSAKRSLASARSASRTTGSCRKKSTRPSPTPSTRPLGYRIRINERVKSRDYIMLLRFLGVRNVRYMIGATMDSSRLNRVLDLDDFERAVRGRLPRAVYGYV